MLRSSLAFVLTGFALAVSAQTTPPPLVEASQAVKALQNFYTPSTGLYRTTGWWNAGNSMTVLANYSRLNNTQAYYPIFANTLKQAATVNPNFLDGYYDDAGWWALGWIDVYDLTKQPQYLEQAQSIFEAMTGAWDTTCGGGVWWNTDRKYKNAITNELFLSVAGELAARTPSGTAVGIGTGAPPRTYQAWAQAEWDWFRDSGMINPDNQINDGLDPATCKNNGQPVYTYNQGVILGGLVQLNALTGDKTLIPEAQTIANTAIARLTDANGILHEQAGEQPGSGGDGAEFKGVFMRNLMALNEAAPDARYKNFADVNARSIWLKDQGPNYQFGLIWSGPFDIPNGASQNSAIDAFLLAASAETLAIGGGAAPPSFTLSAAPTTANLQTGGSTQATVTLAPVNGFTGTVNLSAEVVGAPAGAQATLSTSSLTGKGTATLNVSTTGTTPGGSYLVAVTGTSGNLAQIAYVTVQLPDFTLASASNTLYLNQSGEVADAVTVSPLNGFNGNVTLNATTLPPGVRAAFAPPATTAAGTLYLRAGTLAPTTSAMPIAVSGTAGPTTHTVSSLSLAISAALANCGRGAAVNLQPAFNVTALRSDGTLSTDGGVDGGGFTFSANLTGTGRVLDGTRFVLGAADTLNGILADGQTIALPAGRFNSLQLLGTGAQGTQAAQPLTVTYTDGSSTTFAQSFTDWYGTPTPNANEAEAIAMPYRNQPDGTKQQVQFNIYGYTLALDPAKTAKTLTLPKNRSVVILAASLANRHTGREVDLAGFYNANGLYTDGTAFPAKGGIDGGGSAYSANLLGDTGVNGAELAVGSNGFHLAAANQPNVVYGAGQTIPLPFGLYRGLLLLGTGVQGNQTAQTVRVNFADGSSQDVALDLSDWSTAGGFANEAVALRTGYRVVSDGSKQNIGFNVYQYALPLDPRKPARSITLPNDRNVIVLGMTLSPLSVSMREPVSCRDVDR